MTDAITKLKEEIRSLRGEISKTDPAALARLKDANERFIQYYVDECGLRRKRESTIAKLLIKNGVNIMAVSGSPVDIGLSRTPDIYQKIKHSKTAKFSIPDDNEFMTMSLGEYRIYNDGVDVQGGNDDAGYLVILFNAELVCVYVWMPCLEFEEYRKNRT